MVTIDESPTTTRINYAKISVTIFHYSWGVIYNSELRWALLIEHTILSEGIFMKHCIKMLGKQLNDHGQEITFRPGQTAPDLHWSYRLIDNLYQTQGVDLVLVDSEPQVHIDRRLKDTDPTAFKFLMSFIRINKMKSHIDYNECAMCSGSDKCVVNFIEEIPHTCDGDLEEVDYTYGLESVEFNKHLNRWLDGE